MPRRLIAALVALVTGLPATTLAATTLGVATAAPAAAVNRVTPGNLTGYGFDQCEAPSQSAMDAWLTSSPFWAVGIYIAGGNRACKAQSNLTPTWVETQLRNGWRLLPINVGPQASCYTNPHKKLRIRSDPANGYAAARRQANKVALETVAAAERLGIAPGSALWYDLEHAEGIVTKERCRESALHFLSTWTKTLHRKGYVSGVYAHLHSGIHVLDRADEERPGAFAMPDYIWIARWDGNASVEVDPTYLRPTSWMPHRRVHQYRGDHEETHGGVTITIDSNYLSLGRGTRPGRAPSFCGVQVDFPRYFRLVPGQRHEQVKALQCLLQRKRFYGGKITGVLNLRTQRAVEAYQINRGLRPRGGRVNRQTWTALLSQGRIPLAKVGSGGNQVRRIQRALNAAGHAGLEVSGIFDDATTSAVRAYQEQVGLRRTGVVALDTWDALRAGLM
jgi:hypothetical protein